MQSEIGRNEHELTFLRALQTSGHGSARDALAAGVFAELVPTAMPFARALCVVVDYYLSEGRAARLASILSQAGAPSAAFDDAFGEAIGERHLLTEAGHVLSSTQMHPSGDIRSPSHSGRLPSTV